MFRIVATFLLLAIEILVVSLTFDALPQATINVPGSWMASLSWAGPFARFLTVALVALPLLLGPRLRQHTANLNSMKPGRSRVAVLIPVHLLLFAGFFTVTAALFSVPPVLETSQRTTASIVWLLSGLAVGGSWALILAPFGFWRDFLRHEQGTLLLTLTASLLATLIAYQARHLWDGLAQAALKLVYLLLSVGYDTVFIDATALRLGIGNFIVEIGYPCSGYEGIGLITVFTAVYLYLFRDEFRFPHALWLLPLGITVIWIFNILRIAALIVIGAEISPHLALEGFHSQAGWISFLAVSALILYSAHHWKFARKSDSDSAGWTIRDRLGPVTLLPLISLLAAGLVTGLFTETIDWFYPLKVLVASTALIYCWPRLGLASMPPRPWLQPVTLGVIVAGLWILLASPDPDRDLRVTLAWTQQQSWLSWTWLFFRCVGALLLIPVVEELAFRGYLLARLSRQPIELSERLRPTWPAVIGSSVLFGVLHDAWLAGSAAGLAYAWLRRTSGIWAPIQSHAATNAVLALYVLGTGSWSVW